MLHSGLSSVGRGELDLDGAGLSNNIILAAVLITESVSSNDDWLGPAWYAPRNVRDDNWLSEDRAVKDVPDGSIGTPPHLLEVEFFHSALIGSDRSAFYGNLVLLGCLSAIDRDLVISGIARSDGQVVVFGLEVDVRVDVALLDPLPDHARHFVTIDVNDWFGDLHLAERSAEVSLLGCDSREHEYL